MKNIKTSLQSCLSILITCCSVSLMAQGLEGNKSTGTKKNTSAFSTDFHWGAGIRLGDPSGITVKKYANGNAWELSFGRSHLLGRNGYWDKRYYDIWKDKYWQPYYDKFEYLGYERSAPLGCQLHYLWMKGIAEVEGLAWYYGVGGQFSFQTIRYAYRYKLKGGDWIYDEGGSVTDIDLGTDGVAGMEYFFKEAPLSVFIDLTLFMEVYDNPFVFWFQGGIGGRYNF